MTTVFITVNKNGFVNTWFDEPKRTKNKWVAKYCFVNSLIHKKSIKFVAESNMTFDSEPVALAY